MELDRQRVAVSEPLTWQEFRKDVVPSKQVGVYRQHAYVLGMVSDS